MVWVWVLGTGPGRDWDRNQVQWDKESDRDWYRNQVQVQEVSGGSGFSAQNQRRLHYGLGARTEVDRVVIRWPSGQRQTIERPPVDTLHRIREPR